MLIFQGPRISELVQADVSDLSTVDDWTLLRVRRKGGAVERVPLAPVVVRALDGYLQGRRQGPLLLSRTGRRLNRTNAGRLVKRLAAQALPHRTDVSPHSARHAFVALALSAGVDLDEVRAAPVTHWPRPRCGTRTSAGGSNGTRARPCKAS